MASSMPLHEALAAIRTAADRLTAGAVRNTVATEAMHGKRPESDADACRAAWNDRWGHERDPMGEAFKNQRLYWTGD